LAVCRQKDQRPAQTTYCTPGVAWYYNCYAGAKRDRYLINNQFTLTFVDRQQHVKLGIDVFGNRGAGAKSHQVHATRMKSAIGVPWQQQRAGLI